MSLSVASARAVSLHQPWASLIPLREKTEETRGWETNYRGPLIIHAAKTTQWFDRDKLDPRIVETLEKHNLKFSDLPLGAYICRCNLVDCYPVERATDPTQKPFGNYGPGRFVWKLADIDPIEPQPGRGFQSFWTVVYQDGLFKPVQSDDPNQIRLL